MAKVETESKHVEKTDSKLLKRPLYQMFKSVENYDSPLLKVDLLRKRKKVKSVSDG